MSKVNNMKNKINQALENNNLQGALGKFADAYLDSRAKAYGSRDFEKMRQKVADRKHAAALHMEELAQEFKKNAEARGSKVFIAQTAEEAKQYILDVAKANNVDLIVKSKSMASEEIHLNKHLQEHDLTVAETDLGEWILQLCGQTPSHMVMPAIHLTKGEVAEIFSKEVNERLTDDIPRLVKVARNELRQKFLSAGMGISGANVAVAETGTIAIVTNEGNARLTTTLPPIHVALVGFEKLVEKFTDIQPILECLPRSATGQQLTSYVTMISGPTPISLPDGSLGTKDLHIVLLDNGRTKMKNDAVFNQALQCIRCASCLNVCPVFQLVGGHVYGSVYTGGIGTILTAFFNDFNEASELQNLCIDCKRCKEVCPGKVDIPKLILELRNRVIAKNGMPAGQKFLLNTILPNRKLFHSMLKIASKTQKPFVQDNKIRHLPLFFSSLTEGRSLPALADKSFRESLPNLPKSSKAKVKVGFFGGCLVEFVYPQLGKAVNKILNKLDMELVYPLEQACCGVPAGHLGATEAEAKMAQQNIAAFEKAGVDYIVSVCPTCTATLKDDYVHLLEKDPVWEKRVRDFAAKVTDFTSFVVKHSENGKLLDLKSTGPEVVTYHDSCHNKRHLGIVDEPRNLINACGLKLTEMAFSDRCCGFGGSYSIRFPELSQPILEQKVNSILATEATIVATDCPGCIMQISGGLDNKKAPLKVKHTIELLAERIAD